MAVGVLVGEGQASWIVRISAVLRVNRAAAPGGSSAPRSAGHFFLGNFSVGPQG